MTTGRAAAERWGRKAEARAALWLRLKGYRILATRFKTPMGEIDLIARRGGCIAFVEIKARETLQAGLEAVSPHARQRIARAAEAFLAQRNLQSADTRFDVIVMRPGHLPHHLMDAWRL
jgi:putative endonuclease